MLIVATQLLSVVLNITFLVLAVSLVLALIRLLKGPSLSDRVIALDLLAYISIAIIATNAIATNKAALLDAATVLALIAFLATIAFARYIHRSHRRKGEAQ